MAKALNFQPGDQVKKFILIVDLGRIYPTPTSKSRLRYGIFLCPYCEKEFKSSYQSIISGCTISCGCEKIRKNIDRMTTHNMHGSRLYRTWDSMIGRCNRMGGKHYDDYGGRGIVVCEEWHKFAEFMKWALNNGYTDKLEIDRINNDGNYEPDNCRFVTRSQNVQNTRLLNRKNTSGYRGVSKIKNRDKYECHICNNGIRINLGYFDDSKDAAIAYNNYVIENKTFHPLNIIPETIS